MDQNRCKGASQLVRCRPRSKASVMDTQGVVAGSETIDQMHEATSVMGAIDTALEDGEVAVGLMAESRRLLQESKADGNSASAMGHHTV